MPVQFTARAVEVMRLANEEAWHLNHDYIGTEHILLGLLREGSGVGCGVLRGVGIDLAEVAREVRNRKGGPSRGWSQGYYPQTPRARKAIEFAIEEAAFTHNDGVDTGHLLLGLLREAEGVAGQILMSLLARMGCTLAAVRDRVLSERMRLPDTAEPDALRKPERVSDRDTFVRHSGWRAAFRAARLSVPTSLIFAAAVWFSPLPLRTRIEAVVHVLVWTNVCWMSIAAAIQARQARTDAMSPESRRLIPSQRYSTAMQAALLWVVVIGVAMLLTWGNGPLGVVLPGVIIVALWLRTSFATGDMHLLVAEDYERHEAELLEARRALEGAIVSRFGRLDDGRRAAIQTWDRDRLTEARRRLEDASSIEELDE